MSNFTHNEISTQLPTPQQYADALATLTRLGATDLALMVFGDQPTKETA